MSVTINGKTYNGNSVTVDNNRVFVDGVEVTDKDLPKSILSIDVLGRPVSIHSDVIVNCRDVDGDVTAGGSVNCDDVGGNIHAGGSINCDDVGGNVSAGGIVRRG